MQPTLSDEHPLCELGPITSISAMSDHLRNEHVRINCGRVRKRLMDNHPVHDRRAILVCYGPSLRTTLAAMQADENADIICVGASHAMLLQHHIIPYACIDCDPRQRNVDQLGRPHPAVKYWLASCVDPSYTERLFGYDVSLWHIHNGRESADYVWSIEPDGWLLVGGGSVGLRSISLLYSQGYRSFDIHGMDSSYSDDIEYAGTHLGPPKKNIIRVHVNGRKFTTNPSLTDYARQFLGDQRLWEGATFRMFGDGLLQEMCKAAAMQQAKP